MGRNTYEGDTHNPHNTPRALWRQQRCRGDVQEGRGSRSPLPRAAGAAPRPARRAAVRAPGDRPNETDPCERRSARAHSAQYSLHARTGLFRVPIFHAARGPSSRPRYWSTFYINMDGDMSQGASGDASPIYEDR